MFEKYFYPYLHLIVSCIIVFGFMLLGVYGYIKSINSRKYYVCPNCKESFRVENMESKNCKVCGSKLVEKNDREVTDKA